MLDEDAGAGEGLGHADGVSAGLDQMGMMQEPVNGGRGQGFGHQCIEGGGMNIGRQGDRSAFVTGFHNPVERFSCLIRNRQQPDVINDHQVAVGQGLDSLFYSIIDLISGDQFL